MSKHKAILLETKLKVLKQARLASLEMLVTQFGLPKATIREIIQSKDSIREAIHGQGNEGKCSRICGSKFKDLEEVLLEWFKNSRSKNEQVSGVELKEQILKVAE